MTEYVLKFDAIDPLMFFGVNNSRFKQIKISHPEIEFVARGNQVKMIGEEKKIEAVSKVLNMIIAEITRREEMTDERFTEMLEQSMTAHEFGGGEKEGEVILHGNHGNIIKARTKGQREILYASKNNDIIFAVGPAGTGKTYTAVALAVKALKEKEVRKIFLVRPAVEAGEKLGFLPGDIKEKVDPYLRPLYDALEDMVHLEKLKSYLEKDVIEIAPMAYMRGRTLNSAYVILDEAQNATEAQLKMFLTRMGRGSKVIVTGDPSQIDLPRNQRSGLLQGLDILNNIKGISIIRLKETDVLRHPLVKKIIVAYDKADKAFDMRRKEKKSDIEPS